MITVGDKTHRVVQLDTNALSNMLKAKDDILNKLMSRYPFYYFFFSYSPFSVLEIKKRNDLYARFCELFSLVPSFVLKGFQHLINEEIKGYHKSNSFNVTDFCLHDIRTDGRLLQPTDIDSLFNQPRLLRVFQQWDIDTKEIFEGIQKAQENLGVNKNYTKHQIESFVRQESFIQLRDHDKTFVSSHNLRPDSYEVDKFPTLKIMSFLVYFKFHSDMRKAKLNDVYDILITMTAPYVDVLVTEGQIADSIKKIKKLDKFIDKLEVVTLGEI